MKNVNPAVVKYKLSGHNSFSCWTVICGDLTLKEKTHSQTPLQNFTKKLSCYIEGNMKKCCLSHWNVLQQLMFHYILTSHCYLHSWYGPNNGQLAEFQSGWWWPLRWQTHLLVSWNRWPQCFWATIYLHVVFYYSPLIIQIPFGVKIKISLMGWLYYIKSSLDYEFSIQKSSFKSSFL